MDQKHDDLRIPKGGNSILTPVHTSGPFALNHIR